MVDISVSRVSMARDDDHTSLFGKFCELLSRFSTGGRHLQTRAMSSVKILTAGETARDAAERTAAKPSANSASPSFSASEVIGEGEEARRGGNMGGWRNLPYEKTKGVRSKRGVCREPGFAVSLAGRAERSSGFRSSRRVHDRVTYSKRTVQTAVTKIERSLTWQRHLPTQWNEFARTRFPNNVTLQRG